MAKSARFFFWHRRFLSVLKWTMNIKLRTVLHWSYCCNPQTTAMNLGKAHCLALRALTLDLFQEITKGRKSVIQGFIWITKFESQVPPLLQAKMGQQGKQMRVGAREGFARHSVKLVLLANVNRYEVDSSTFFQVVKPSIHLKFCPVSILTFFDAHMHL
jgi:hypothetical protein